MLLTNNHYFVVQVEGEFMNFGASSPTIAAGSSAVIESVKQTDRPALKTEDGVTEDDINKLKKSLKELQHQKQVFIIFR